MSEKIQSQARSQILLVEDNPGDVFLIQEAIGGEDGAELRVVTDGEQALEYLAAAETGGSRRAPDLILLDINLPKRSGDEILARIRAGALTRDVPVIVVTSSESPRERAHMMELGADYYFSKPINLDEYMKIGAITRRLLAEAHKR
ncbi:MAG: response regulator [Bryobacteraceae bacterium]|nr:response regulator [Bryobacteraceae bacterium]